MGFAQPFMIQTAAIPVAMEGRDVCGRARTGSGKTLAFGVPMMARITEVAASARPLGLVLVPTRELAIQVAEVLEPVAAHAGQRVLAVYGGASRPYQVEQLRLGVEIVVATPLRLIDLHQVGRGEPRLACRSSSSTRPTAWPTTGSRRRSSGSCATASARRQTMLFSATLDGDVGHLIRHYLRDPVEVAIDAATDTVGTMHHVFLAVHHMDKDRVIAAIGQGHPQAARVLPDQAPVRQGGRLAAGSRRRRRRDPRRPAAGVARASAAALRRGSPEGPGGHRRRRSRASTSTTSAR